MYIIPGYTKYEMANDSLIIKSELFQSEIIIDEQEMIEEFFVIVKNKGFDNINTDLKRVLHEQGILQTEKEIVESLEEVKKICDDDLFITIMLTENCNFKCAYCYENITNKMMTDKTFNHIKNYIVSNMTECNNLNISWFGGEPTLCKKKILEFSYFLKMISKKHGVQYLADMTTNGYLLDIESFIDYFNAGIKYFQITIDGFNHDNFRPHKNGDKTLEKILNNILNISELNNKYDFNITIRRNISKNNDDLEWYDYLKTIICNDDRFKMMVAITSDWGGSSVKSLELIEDNKNSIKELHNTYIENIGLSVVGKNKSLYSDVCYSSFKKGFIFRSNGNIEKCTIVLGKSGNIVGHVDSQLGVIIDDELNKVWTKSSIDKACIRCNQVLSCLNIACRKPYAVDGVKSNICLCKIKWEEC